MHRYSTLTFLCQIITENNLRSVIQAMLDNCSNLSILKPSVADKLSMKGEKCDLQLSVTGANKVIFKKQKKMRFRLASLGNKYVTDFICEASTAPNILNSFERIAIDPKDFDYLSEIQFTEPLRMSEESFEANQGVDLLLGLPFQFHIREPPYFILGPLGSPHTDLEARSVEKKV